MSFSDPMTQFFFRLFQGCVVLWFTSFGVMAAAGDPWNHGMDWVVWAGMGALVAWMLGNLFFLVLGFPRLMARLTRMGMVKQLLHYVLVSRHEPTKDRRRVEPLWDIHICN